MAGKLCFEMHFKVFLRSIWRDNSSFSVFQLVSWLFNVNLKFRLSFGDETTRVCVCVTPQADKTTHPWQHKACKSTHALFLWDNLISAAARHAHALPTNMHPKTHKHMITHRSSFSMSCSSMARIHFRLIQRCPLPGTAVLLGLNHMFTVLVGGSLGHVAHLPARTIQGSLVSSWLVQRACGDSEAQPEVERSWSLRALELHEDMSIRGGQRCQETGTFLIYTEIELLLIAPWLPMPVRRVKATPPTSPPGQVTQVKLVRLL